MHWLITNCSMFIYSCYNISVSFANVFIVTIWICNAINNISFLLKLNIILVNAKYYKFSGLIFYKKFHVFIKTFA